MMKVSSGLQMALALPLMYKCSGGALCTLDIESASQTRWVPSKRGHSLFRVSWSPDGGHVVFVEIGSFPPETDVTAPWTYFSVVSMSASRRVRLGRGARENTWPHSWSPDGQYLVFLKGNLETREIFIVSADGRRQSQLTHNSHYDEQPAWQPQVP
jgi:Tol biopolymer transport system component